MCRCCQNCLEDCYWNCIEEKFCYDETIAYYNPDEDEHYHKKMASNGVTVENNNSPICRQPSRLDRNCSVMSSKIHEDEFCREIQTNVPILAPEILSVFANSQIFHDHQPKSIVAPPPAKQQLIETPAVHKKTVNRTDSEKLLDRLEGRTITDGPIDTSQKTKVSVLINDVQIRNSTSTLSLVSHQSIRQIVPIKEEDTEPGQEDETDVDEVQIRLKFKEETRVFDFATFLKPNPQFENRNVSSMNDIYSISGGLGQIAETPQIRYSNLPKNYLDTPVLPEYREATSLYALQKAESARILEIEQYKMPRNPFASVQQMPARVHSAENLQNPPKKSKRLNAVRKQLPPLVIGNLTKENNKIDE